MVREDVDTAGGDRGSGYKCVPLPRKMSVVRWIQVVVRRWIDQPDGSIEITYLIRSRQETKLRLALSFPCISFSGSGGSISPLT